MDSVDDWDYLDAADYGSRLAWAVKHGLASFTHEEAARREAECEPAGTLTVPDLGLTFWV